MSEAGAEGLVERLRDERHCNDWYLRQEAAAALEANARALAEARAAKDGAYAERNQCVALIAKFAWAHGCRVGIAKTAIEGWDEAWHGCVYIDLPTGQVSWHYHDSDAHLFDFLAPYQGEWDGHSTPEKYARVNAAYPIRPTVLEREMAEARAEIERLRKERDHWKFGHDASERQRDAALEALRPLARLEIPKKPQGNAGAYSIRHDHIRAARAVLENSKGRLADANQSKSSSSQDQEIAGLREEVRRKDEALRNVRGLIDTPVARRKHHNDPFYEDVIASLRSALSPLDGEA